MTRGTRSLLIAVSSGPSLVSCSSPGYGPGGGWDHMIGHGFGGVFMGVPFIILVAVVIFLMLRKEKPADKHGQSPLEILKSRYARGEITKEEFEKMKKDIGE